MVYKCACLLTSILKPVVEAMSSWCISHSESNDIILIMNKVPSYFTATSSRASSFLYVETMLNVPYSVTRDPLADYIQMPHIIKASFIAIVTQIKPIMCYIPNYGVF